MPLPLHEAWSRRLPDPPLRRLRGVPQPPVPLATSISFEVQDRAFEFDPWNGPSPREQGPRGNVHARAVGASQVAGRCPRCVAEKHTRPVDTRDRAEVDVEVTANRDRATSDFRHIPFERALEPVPVECGGQGNDADEEQGASCGRSRPYSPSAQYLRDAVHPLNAAIGPARAASGLPRDCVSNGLRGPLFASATGKA